MTYDEEDGKGIVSHSNYIIKFNLLIFNYK